MAEWILFVVLAGFSVFDLKWKKVNVIAVTVSGIVTLTYRICDGTGVPALILGLVPGILLLLVSFCTKESIGVGDGLVVCVIGIFCGIKRGVAVLGMALLLCAVLAMLLLACKRVNRKTELPFLPCLCAGYLLCLLW